MQRSCFFFFFFFWKHTIQREEELKVEPPALPRQRCAPSRFELGQGAGHHHSCVEDLFRQQYFECLDYLTACV